MRTATIAIVSAIFLLQGCASLSTKQNKPADVTSTPSGAAVFVNGLEVGKTPLRKDLYDEFPAGWKNSIYQAQGVLMVKMDNCKDYALKINDLILRKPIHAELECGKVSTTQKSIPAVTAQVETENKTEERLKKLESLFKKGVITKDEYQKNRERILSEL